MIIGRAVVALAIAQAFALPAHAADGEVICGARHDIALVNGKIHTMEKDSPVTGAVLIRDGVIAALGDIGAPGPCTTVIDLDGHIAVPGLIDNHVHFIRLGNLPGRHMRDLERAFDVRTAQAMIRHHVSEVPAGAFLTLIGGIEPTQFKEGRFPTLAELDAAAPANPVYISADGFGPGQTNTPGRELLRRNGIPVGDDGSVAAQEPTAKVFDVLSAKMSVEERQQAILDEQEFALSVGLTTVMDQSGTVPGVGYMDQSTGYDPFLGILRADKLKIRVRLFFPAMDAPGGANGLLLRQLDNKWHDYGPDLARIVGVGEWSVGMDEFNEEELSPQAAEAVMKIAERGWPYHQHVITEAEIERYLSLFEKVAAAGHDLGKLHWSLDHVNGITRNQIERANKLGIGLAANPWPYLPERTLTGPPTRLILDTATIPVGGGSDGARISTLNPWSMIYYMVTGRNNARKLVNPGQQITREEAIRLWTGPDQGFFSNESGRLGGLAPGVFADLTVLDKDYFDPKAVSDDDIRSLSSILTIVGGRIVHDDGSLSRSE
jgi:predicted amidohydrolase YtcJ